MNAVAPTQKSFSIIVFLFLLLTLQSCRMVKVMTLMRKGSVGQSDFKTEIPFSYKTGHIIIKASIEGIEYDFLLDSGASCGISSELAEKLNVSPILSYKINDIAGNSSHLNFVVLDSININNITFRNVAASVDNYNLSNAIKCYDIDGIIGSNLMKEAIWKIDFKNQKIKIADNLEDFNLDTAKHFRVPFIKGAYHPCPNLLVELHGNSMGYAILDLGSNGGIQLSFKKYKKHRNLLKNNQSGYGSMWSGLLGSGQPDTIYFAMAPKLNLGDLFLTEKVVSFTKKSIENIGTRFLENYSILLNWKDKEILFYPQKEYAFTSIETYGFKTGYKNQGIFVKFLYQNSSAERAGLQLGDQIIRINEMDYSHVSHADWCNIRTSGLLLNTGEISIWILRDGNILKFNLVKEVLLD